MLYKICAVSALLHSHFTSLSHKAACSVFTVKCYHESELDLCVTYKYGHPPTGKQKKNSALFACDVFRTKIKFINVCPADE